MKLRHSVFMLIVSASAFLPGCACNSNQEPTYTPDPTLPRLEHDFSQVRDEIKKTQEQVRKLLAEMVTDIEEGNIDAARTATEVEQTIDAVQRLKYKIQKLRGVKPDNVPGPVT